MSLFYFLISRGPTPKITPQHLSYYIHTQLLEFSILWNVCEFLKSLLFTQLFVSGLTTNRGPLSDARLEPILNYILDEPLISGFWIIQESSIDP